MKYLFKLFRAIFTLPNNKKWIKNSIQNNRDFLLLKNDTIKSLSNLIISEFSLCKNKIFQDKEEKNRLKNKDYHLNITSYFSKEVLNEVESKLKSKNILDIISNHFGYNIKFSQFIIRFNYFNPLSLEEYSAKMWHRDNDSLINQLKLFLVLNDLSDEIGGYFYFIPQNQLPAHKKISSNYSSSENFTLNDMSSRIKNTDVDNKYNLGSEVIRYGDDINSALVLDTNDTYHKGGFIKKKDGHRILLQAIYEPKYLSLSNYSKYSKNLLYRSIKIFLLGIKNRLRTNI